LLAAQLAIADVSQRIPALMPLIWIEAILPGAVFAWLLFVPRVRLPAFARRPRLGTP
jgi:hypothetical protein